ncbi:PREDICTED: thiosulfate sulfurtransferase/rhodanese-like domain-containing protein 3 [Elephantulus edwardii]|uniref:thiosulfate sulfurtransferase/rhodanese-like domain-containing protein 3 n=1 Tax=Elephantulus edwardii TaxID=28737 RepID=UPI0003F0D5B5|nr:PREDICTED: thiosulfate sulfurtransferase/rhodanese-like domain-containing protein 3 [Elephantulus edwardii]
MSSGGSSLLRFGKVVDKRKTLEKLDRHYLAGVELEGAREAAAHRPGDGRRKRSVRSNGAAGTAALECAQRGLQVGGSRALGDRNSASLKSINGSWYNFSTAVSKEITYKELKNLLTSKNVMLVDVRETWEILKSGKIPGSINIPLDEVGQALQMNARDFKDKYNEVKPSESDNLVFSCFAGVRSKKALDTALSLGFNSAQHYAGGWKEWATYEFPEKKKGS